MTDRQAVDKYCFTDSLRGNFYIVYRILGMHRVKVTEIFEDLTQHFVLITY